jgi:hypothetical protein
MHFKRENCPEERSHSEAGRGQRAALDASSAEEAYRQWLTRRCAAFLACLAGLLRGGAPAAVQVRLCRPDPFATDKPACRSPPQWEQHGQCPFPWSLALSFMC